MILSSIFFYIFAGILLLAGTLVVVVRNPVHSVLFLILTFSSAAGLFVLLGAEFLGMIVLVVYVGAVAVLFLFVVMMLDINFVALRQGFLRYLPVGLLVAGIVLAELIAAGSLWVGQPLGSVLQGGGEGVGAPGLPLSPERMTNTEELGLVLYTTYAYPFQIAGMILLLAMVGAIVLALRHRTGIRRQVIAVQVARRPEDCVELRKVESGKGI